MRQRGFIQLSLFGWIAVGGAVALALAVGAATIQTKRLSATKAEYAGFEAKVEAEGKLAEQERIRKEAEYAKSIKTAVAGRNAALGRLRLASAARSQASLSPAPAVGSDRLCFGAAEFAGAVEQYRSRVRAIVTEGDAAGIDAKALIEAWPR